MKMIVDNCYKLLYTVYDVEQAARPAAGKGSPMNIIISTTSMTPIYEQLLTQIEGMIASGTLAAGEGLPSVRAMAKELRISALTVKKAYDRLEEEGLVQTVHGKGTYVTGLSREMMAEQQRREIEIELEQVVRKAKAYGLTQEELKSLLTLMLEE